MILLIDNYDSFVHNLARYFRRLGQETHVVRNDAITMPEIQKLAPTAIVLSPGPCDPVRAGCSLEVVRTFSGQFPLLGVCLGHQAIAAAYGATIVRSREPMHGRGSPVFHDGSSPFEQLPSPFHAGRYHSLMVEPDSLPEYLQVNAWTQDGTVMGVRHRDYPTYGLQFHPESILTSHGYALLENFLRTAGAAGLGDNFAERVCEINEAELQRLPERSPPNLPDSPLTF